MIIGQINYITNIVVSGHASYRSRAHRKRAHQSDENLYRHTRGDHTTCVTEYATQDLQVFIKLLIHEPGSRHHTNCILPLVSGLASASYKQVAANAKRLDEYEN